MAKVKSSKTLNEWSRKEFIEVPSRKWGEDIGEFDSLVILPESHLHDSGYRAMDFIACLGDTPIFKLSGCSDIINIDGIGGFGVWDKKIPSMVPVAGWSMDCLKKSRLLRLSCNGKLSAGPALSSFEVYFVSKTESHE